MAKKNAVSPKAARLLRKVAAHILEEPKRFNLNDWGGIVDPKFFDELGDYSSLEQVLATQRPPCGAVGCIAGNLLLVAGVVKPKKFFDGHEVYEFDMDTRNKAANILGISKDNAKDLFYLRKWGYHRDDGSVAGWPPVFASRLQRAKPGGKAYARAAGDRIEHFIKTGK